MGKEGAESGITKFVGIRRFIKGAWNLREAGKERVDSGFPKVAGTGRLKEVGSLRKWDKRAKGGMLREPRDNKMTYHLTKRDFSKVNGAQEPRHVLLNLRFDCLP